MQGNVTKQELADLHTVAQTDRRAYDLWAWDDDFVKELLIYTFANRHQKDRAWTWKRAIDMYWKGGATRRELAAELRRTIDAVKSLLKTIRRSATRFLAIRTSAELPEGFKTPYRIREWPTTHAISENDILDLAKGDSETQAFVEEYARLEVASRLRLFDANISAKLLHLLDRSDAIDSGAMKSTEEVSSIISEALTLKLSVAKSDPFEGRSFFPFGPEKGHVAPKGRGRPRHDKIKKSTKEPIEPITPHLSEGFSVVQDTRQTSCEMVNA